MFYPLMPDILAGLWKRGTLSLSGISTVISHCTKQEDRALSLHSGRTPCNSNLKHRIIKRLKV